MNDRPFSDEELAERRAYLGGPHTARAETYEAANPPLRLRRAVVLCRNDRPARHEVEAYLPRNYRVIGHTPAAILIQGHDNAGWTLDDYVIPRLGSGLITAREIPADQRMLHEIHDEIVRDWKRPYYAALPYIQAMRYLGTLYDSYGDQDAERIVRYFLNNAGTWKGETARRVKAELREMLEKHNA